MGADKYLRRIAVNFSAFSPWPLLLILILGCSDDIPPASEADAFGRNLIEFNRSGGKEIRLRSLMNGSTVDGRICILPPYTGYEPRYYGPSYQDVGVLFKSSGYEGSEYKWAVAYKGGATQWVKQISRNDLGFEEMPLRKGRSDQYCGLVGEIWVLRPYDLNLMRFVIRGN